MSMLEVKDLHVYYGVIQALKGISFEVNPGRGYCFDRCQWCRKTTTLQTLTGLLSAKKVPLFLRRKRYYQGSGP